jgi:cysteine synthase
MSRSFITGLLLCTPLPWMVYRLRMASRTLDAILAPYVAAGAGTEGSAPAAALSREQQERAPSVRLVVVENRPSDPVPQVTPEGAKASRIRRAVTAPPCHDCACCAVYATRLHDAHAEITRLRDELGRDDAHRINSQPPRLSPDVVRFSGAGGEC